MRRALVLLGLVFLGACTREVQVDRAPALEVYSNYATKVPGKWLVVVESVPLHRDIQLPGETCTEVDYPFDVKPALDDSVVASFRNLVEEARKGDAKSAAAPSGYTGIIRLRADDLRVTLRPKNQFWGYEFGATVDIDMSLTVDGPRGRILDTVATGSGTSEGSAGILCDGGGPIFAHAAQGAMTDALTQLADKFAGSQEIRRAFDTGR